MTTDKPKRPRARMAAGVAALAGTFVAGWEGVQLVAYRDPVGIVTVCAGETRGVKMGDRYTREECSDMLRGRLDEFYGNLVARCAPWLPGLPGPAQVAHLSLAYNIGEGAYCKSSIVRLQAAGYREASCDAFRKWNKAGGVVFRGLTRRREAERELCLRPA